jgi:antitoxin component YwqK of YwqJK toxin-antitoxin module
MKKNTKLFFEKICVLLFLLIWQLQAYSQTAVRPINGPRSEKNVSDELGRKQGTWKYYYRNKDLREEVNYVNNLPEGLNTKYFKGKKPQIECNYFGGRKDGDYKKYYFSGQIAVEGKYIYGRKDEVWTSYYEDGQTKTVREYRKGVKEGDWKVYNRKGVLISSVSYKNGVNTNAPPPSEKSVLNKKVPIKTK